MAYISRRGRRPAEYASKASHGHVVNDEEVRDFLSHCDIPKKADQVAIPLAQLLRFQPVLVNPIKHIIAVDGGYEEVPVQVEFPSATICFFQFGALIFGIEDLESIGSQPFIDPEDMSRLKQIQRFKLTMPVRNVVLEEESSLTHSIRRTFFEFFNQKLDHDEDRLIDTLRWLVFQEYEHPLPEWVLGSCPHCRQSSIPLFRSMMSEVHTFRCKSCGGEIFLTDVFRLHEAVDDELGAGGILGYVTTTFEQMILFHIIRLILKLKPNLLQHVLFIKDGPLAFFGQTANMHKPVRDLVRYLFKNHDLFLAGLEKSGAFVEHADEIADKLNPGSILILNNDYIYRYVLPGKADPANPYGRSTYYGNKIIFKTLTGGIHVVTLPTTDTNPNPHQKHFRNLEVTLSNVEKLKCDMYDNALLPVALANKLVSLAQFPSSRILQRFALAAMAE